MPKSVNLTLICLFYFVTTAVSYSQNKLDKKLIPFSKPLLTSKWEINIIDSNIIEYAFTDSIDLCWAQDLSPIYYYCLDTLTIRTFRLKLSFESGWNKKRIKDNKFENEVKIDKIRRRLIAYGDSINWNFYKNSKQLVESKPLNYIQFIKNWTQDELTMLASIQKLPFDLYKGYGVFIKSNAGYITPSRKQQDIDALYLQLQEMGIKNLRIFTQEPEKYKDLTHFSKKEY